MAASSITSTFFMLASPSSGNSTNQSKICLQRPNRSSNTNEKAIKLRLNSSSKIKFHVQAVVNDEKRVTSMIESSKDEETASPPATMEHSILSGRLLKGGLVFMQNFCIRSFEVDTDSKVSTRAIMNYLQEASFNYRKQMSADALFGITPEMSKRDLVLVFRSLCIEVDRYPSWLVVMMNKKTRKACKCPEEVKQELKPYVTIQAEPIVEAQRHSYPQVETMDHIRTGLTPRWNDLDFNHHVNNANYVDWILESAPRSLITNSHELCKINIEYRKECLKGDVIQSLSRVVTNETHLSINNPGGVELEHVLRLESGPEVLRARTGWRPK